MPLLGPPNIQKLREKRKTKRLIKALTYNKDSKRTKAHMIVRDAVQALREIGDRTAVEPLISILDKWKKNVNGGIHQTVLVTLGEIGDERAIPKLISLLSAASSHVASEALVMIGKEAVDPLIKVITKSNQKQETIINALGALGKIGDKRAVRPIIGLINLYSFDDGKGLDVTLLKTLLRIEYNEEVKDIVCRLNRKAIPSASGLLAESDGSAWKNAVMALSDIKDRDWEKPFIRALEDSNKELRKISAEQLGNNGSVECIIPLLFTLGDQEKEVQIAALTSLGRIGNKDVLKPIVRFLKEPDTDYRECALNSLLGLANNEVEFDKRSIDFLISLIQSPTIDQKLRLQTIQLLGKVTCSPYSTSRIRDFVQSMLIEDDCEIRKHAAHTLGEISSRDSTKSLIRALEDTDFSVRQAAADTLGKISDFRATLPLINLLKDENANVRKEAASSLGLIGDERSMDNLLMLLEDSDPQIRVAAIIALGNVRGDFSRQPLVSLLDDQNLKVVNAAINVLGELNDNKAVDRLIDKLKDAHAQRAAVKALGKMQARSAIAPLLKLLKENNHSQAVVAWALGEIGDTEAAKPLFDCFMRHRYRCASYAQALAQIGGPEVVEYLCGALTAKDIELSTDQRENAVIALGDIGAPQAVPALKSFLAKKKYGNRSLVFSALAKIPDADIWKQLIREFKKESTYDPIPLLRAFGDLGDHRAIDIIIPHLEGKYETERLAAIYAIRQLVTTQCIELLIGLLESGSEAVRKAASEALVNNEDIVVDRIIESFRNMVGRIENFYAVPPLFNYLNPIDAGTRRIQLSLVQREISDLTLSASWLGGRASTSENKRQLKKIEHEVDKKQAMLSDAYLFWGIVDVLWEIGLHGGKKMIKVIDSLSEKGNEGAKITALLNHLGQPSSDLLKQLIQSSSQNIRAHIVRKLGEVNDPKVVPSLIELLRNDAPEVRRAAAQALADAGDEDACHALHTALNDSYKGVMVDSLFALSRIGCSDIFDPIVNALKSEDLPVRLGACKAISESGSTQYTEPLFSVLHDSRMQKEVLKVLGELKDPASLNPIVNLLTSNDSTIRLNALKALLKIDGTLDVTAILECLGDKEPEVRITAVRILGKEGSAEAVNYLLARLDEEPDDSVRVAIIKSLGKNGTSKPLKRLISLLEDDQLEIRKSAAEALGETGDPRAIDPLCQALKIKDMRNVCALALGKIGGSTAIEDLVKILMDGYFVAADVLQNLGWQPFNNEAGSDFYANKKWWSRCADIGKAALPSLQKFLTTTWPPVVYLRLDYEELIEKKLAIKAVTKIGSEDKVNVLNKVLNSEQNFDIVKRIIVEELHRLRNKEAYQPLFDHLPKCSGVVKDAIVFALREIPDSQWRIWGNDLNTDGLVKALRNWDETIHRLAGKILVAIGSPVAESLVPLIKDKDWWIRERSIDILGDIGDPIATVQLLTSLSGKEIGRKEKEKIIEALGKIGDKRAIEPLIGMLKTYYSYSSDNYQIKKALRKITGLKESDWKKWWAKRRP